MSQKIELKRLRRLTWECSATSVVIRQVVSLPGWLKTFGISRTIQVRRIGSWTIYLQGLDTGPGAVQSYLSPGRSALAKGASFTHWGSFLSAWRDSISLASVSSLILAGGLLVAPPAIAAPDAEISDFADVASVANAALVTVGVAESDQIDLLDESSASLWDAEWEDVALDTSSASVAFDDLGLEISLPISLDAVETSASGAVASSEDGSLSVAVVPTEDGSARILAVADEQYSASSLHTYEYGLSLHDGFRLLQLNDGDVVFVTQDSTYEATPEELELGLGTHDVIVGGLAAPWAVDATGSLLPTSFTVDGQTLTQHVDTNGAVFPVVSDPLPLVAIYIAANVALRVGISVAARAFAVVVPRVGLRVTASTGRTTFAQAKALIGNLKPNYDWHHIVVQSQTKFAPTMIHNTKNLIQVPRAIHQKCLTPTQNGTRVGNFLGVNFRAGQGRITDQVRKLTYQQQYDFGVRLLRFCGVIL